MTTKSRYLTPLTEEVGDPLKDFTDLRDKYLEIEEKNDRITSALGAISESSLLNPKTQTNLRSLIRESNQSNKAFKRDLRRKRSLSRKRKYLSVITEEPKIKEVVQDVHEKKLTPEDLMKEMMCQKLSKDWNLNSKLTETEKRQIANQIMKLESIIVRYRNYYGKNPLKWTPEERKTVSAIYIALSKEYEKLGYEEGQQKNKLIADNLLNNPLNKMKRFSMPSAPRGCAKAIGPKTFCKFADDD